MDFLMSIRPPLLIARGSLIPYPPSASLRNVFYLIPRRATRCHPEFVTCLSFDGLNFPTAQLLILPAHLTMSDKAAARARFEGVFDSIAEELLAYLKENGMPAEAIQWYKDVSREMNNKRGRRGRSEVQAGCGLVGW